MGGLGGPLLAHSSLMPPPALLEKTSAPLLWRFQRGVRKGCSQKVIICSQADQVSPCLLWCPISPQSPFTERAFDFPGPLQGVSGWAERLWPQHYLTLEDSDSSLSIHSLAVLSPSADKASAGCSLVSDTFLAPAHQPRAQGLASRSASASEVTLSSHCLSSSPFPN